MKKLILALLLIPALACSAATGDLYLRMLDGSSNQTVTIVPSTSFGRDLLNLTSSGSLTLGTLTVDSLVVTGSYAWTFSLVTSASASTLDASTWTGNVVKVTGTTAVTDVSNLSGKNGCVFYLWTDDVTGVVLTHGNNIVCANATNITLNAASPYVIGVVTDGKLRIKP